MGTSMLSQSKRGRQTHKQRRATNQALDGRMCKQWDAGGTDVRWNLKRLD